MKKLVNITYMFMAIILFPIAVTIFSITVGFIITKNLFDSLVPYEF